ncbi:MAG: nuclear transport factor 2 family protein [Gammaproteobacteria bacterium]|nr:nuclear transport factor 2 family protein [Gammaproteobacteria bacterium]
MANCYLAQEASRKSGKYVVEGARQAWLDLFADDALVQDPVGVSPLDPSGLGHQGKKAIAAFWDMAMPNGIASFEIRESHPAGDSCANVVTLSNRLPDGTVVSTDCVAVYTANDAGKIISLRAYWDFSKLAAQLEKMAAAS